MFDVVAQLLTRRRLKSVLIKLNTEIILLKFLIVNIIIK